GGTSVNTIAQSADMLYEYRSTSRECLAYMKSEFERITDKVGKEFADKGVSFTVELLGDRPCGGDIDPEKQEALLTRCEAELEKAYGEEIFRSSSSTDCNIPMSMGIPATCFGIVKQAGTHKREEHMFLDYLPGGVKAANEIFSYYLA
ncbi:MAG: peptidase, partial [Clostridia bacterium]|nr:peptidase [Clostridia bacterium]